MRIERIFSQQRLDPSTPVFDRGGPDGISGALQGVRLEGAAQNRAFSRENAARERQTAALLAKGQADAELGRVISRAGKDLTEIATQRQARQNQQLAETEFQNAKSALGSASDMAEDFALQGAADGSDYLKRYRDRYSELRDRKILPAITNPDAKRFAAAHAGEVEMAGSRRIRHSQARQASRFAVQQLDIRIGKRQTRIAKLRGPEQQAVLAEANGDIAEQQRLGNIANAQGRISALRIWAQNTVHTDALSDPDGARAFLQDGGYDHLFANDVERTANAAMIEAARKSRRAVEAGEVRELRQEDLARLRSTGRGLPNLDRRLERLGDDTIRATHRLRQIEAFSEYSTREQIGLLTQQEAAMAVGALAPQPGTKTAAEQQARYDGARTALRKWRAALKYDPMAVVVGSPFVTTLAQAIGAQKRTGVAYPSVFTRTEAARQGEIYREARGAEKIAAMNRALADSAGYRALAIWDLLQANPAPSAAIVALHGDNPAMQPFLKQLVAAEDKGWGDLEKGHTEEQLAELRAAVAEQSAAFVRTALAIPGRDETAIAEQTGDGIYLYALDLMAAGRSTAGAAKIAADKAINEHFHFLGTYRVPRPHDAAAVQNYTSAVLARLQDNLTDRDLNPMQWRNTPDGKGLMLLDVTGEQITDMDGKPIRVSFGDAAARGSESADNALGASKTIAGAEAAPALPWQ